MKNRNITFTSQTKGTIPMNTQSNATKLLATPRAMPMKAFLALICGLALACATSGQVTSTGGGGGNQSGTGMGRQFTRKIVSKHDKVRNVGAHEERKSQNPPPKKKQVQSTQHATTPTGGRQVSLSPNGYPAISRHYKVGRQRAPLLNTG
jgi:hypothetical protein